MQNVLMPTMLLTVPTLQLDTFLGTITTTTIQSSSSILSLSSKLPKPKLLLQKPYYVYEELLWLNATLKQEHKEIIELISYVWKIYFFY